MKLRKTTTKDLKKIQEIFAEGNTEESELQFPNISTKEMKKDLEKNKKHNLKQFKKGLKNKKHHWIVAEDKGEVIGFGQAYIRDKNTGNTESVYVNKQHRKKGVGKKIMEELIKWLKSKKLKYVESNAYINNKPSVKLHKKLGFKPVLVRMSLSLK